MLAQVVAWWEKEYSECSALENMIIVTIVFTGIGMADGFTVAAQLTLVAKWFPDKLDNKVGT